MINIIINNHFKMFIIIIIIYASNVKLFNVFYFYNYYYCINSLLLLLILLLIIIIYHIKKCFFSFFFNHRTFIISKILLVNNFKLANYWFVWPEGNCPPTEPGFSQGFFSILSPMEFSFLAAVASGLLSWGHFISSTIIDLIAQILFKLN